MREERDDRKRRATVLAWKLMMVCDLLVGILAMTTASFMLGSTCRVSPTSTNGATANDTDSNAPPPNATNETSSGGGELHIFVHRPEEQDCSEHGGTEGFAEPYPWAMLMSTLTFLYGKGITHLLRWGTLAHAEDSTTSCCARGAGSFTRMVLMVLRFLASQGVAVLLLLFTSLSHDPSLGALTVDMYDDLEVFQWAMIAIPASLLFLVCCACGMVVFVGCEIDVTCDGAGDGMLGPSVCIGLGSVMGLVMYGAITMLNTLTSSGDELLHRAMRGLLLAAPSSLPPVSEGVGFFTPLIVSMLVLNIVQVVALILSFIGPRLARLYYSYAHKSESEELNSNELSNATAIVVVGGAPDGAGALEEARRMWRERAP